MRSATLSLLIGSLSCQGVIIDDPAPEAPERPEAPEAGAPEAEVDRPRDPSPPADPGVAPAGACDAIAARATWSVCTSTPSECHAVYEDGAGCDRVCEAAGMRCVEARENDGDRCAAAPSGAYVPCAGAGHASDYCVCSSAPCVPSCAGVPCGGDDGCGGTCGECPEPDPSCVALTAEEYENNEGNDAEFTAKFFPTRDRDSEYIDMFFRSDDHGTHRYGEGDNADLYTCDQCMLVFRDGRFFYPTSGTITIHAGSAPLGRRLVATLSELRLIEIEISGSYHSIPVPGGECITLAATTIDAR